MTQKFTKTETIKAQIKGLVIHEGMFMDEESGEAVNLVEKLKKVYSEDTPFDLSTTLKTDEDLDI